MLALGATVLKGFSTSCSFQMGTGGLQDKKCVLVSSFDFMMPSGAEKTKE